LKSCNLNHNTSVNRKHLKRKDAKKPSTYKIQNILKLKSQLKRTGLVLARHAEENALEKYHSCIGIKGRKKIAPRKLHMIVIRINSVGDLTESKPCSHCVDVMRSYGIRKVTYSTKEGTFVTESLAVIISQPSVGYRSVDRAINILDNMINFYSEGVG
jgi:deoxycytidylate deaminase